MAVVLRLLLNAGPGNWNEKDNDMKAQFLQLQLTLIFIRRIEMWKLFSEFVKGIIKIEMRISFKISKLVSFVSS